MEKFKFNKNSVCTNPNVIRREDGQCSFEIDTAIGRYERWVYGCSCNLISTGFGSPCMDKAQYPLPSYPTEKDAIKAACKEIRKFLAKNTTGSDPNKAGKTVKLYDKKLVSLLDEIERPQPKELSLFGFDYCDNIQCDRMTICGRYNPCEATSQLCKSRDGHDCKYFKYY